MSYLPAAHTCSRGKVWHLSWWTRSTEGTALCRNSSRATRLNTKTVCEHTLFAFTQVHTPCTYACRLDLDRFQKDMSCKTVVREYLGSCQLHTPCSSVDPKGPGKSQECTEYMLRSLKWRMCLAHIATKHRKQVSNTLQMSRVGDTMHDASPIAPGVGRCFPDWHACKALVRHS